MQRNYFKIEKYSEMNGIQQDECAIIIIKKFKFIYL